MKTLVIAAGACALATLSLADDVVLDQIGADNSYTNGLYGYASQEFASYLSDYDINVLDNFTVSALDAGAITEVEAVFMFWSGGYLNAVRGWRVEIYSSPAAAGANLVGDIGHVQVDGTLNPVVWGTNALGSATYKVTIPVNGITLGPGSYYLGVMGIMFHSGAGQMGIMNSTLGDLNAYQANPGQGFGSGTYWSIAANAAYRLKMVPEPAGVLAIALVGLIRRR